MSGLDTPGTVAQPPLVSVIINCYNGERYLREAIDSVYAQTWPAWEIIFWDNASTDNSGAIARSYDERLRYFLAERNTPLGEARNLAFAQARGEFISMLDCDDVWLPGTLQWLVAGMEDDECKYAACYGSVELIDAGGRRIGRKVRQPRRGNLFPFLLHEFDVVPSASMVRRSVLVECGHRFDSSFTASEDYWFFMNLAVEHTFQSLSQCVCRYRIHEGALTNRTIAKWADEWEYTLVHIRTSHPGIEERYRRQFRHALARVDYNRARYLMQKGERSGARRLLVRDITVDLRYLGLFLLSLMPPKWWDLVHFWYHKRSQYS